MKLTIDSLSHYLGKKASVFLSDAPFKAWPFEKSIEMELEKPLVDYVFARHGMDFVCDNDETINSIFLYADESRRFTEDVQDLPLTASRQEVIARLGYPSKSGGPLSDSILGKHGPWDRFARPTYVLHVEYHVKADAIKKITLMRSDIVP